MYKSFSYDEKVINEVSTLYPIEPIGKGTFMVESLTSYISRLAFEHNVTTSLLMKKIIIPLLPQDQGTARKFVWAINDCGDKAKAFTVAIRKLTLRDDIDQMSLINWKDFLPGLVIRKIKAWCPVCLEEWRVSDQCMYEPLLWAFIDIVRCPIHQSRLIEYCPHCLKCSLVLKADARIGYCGFCNKWVGSMTQCEISLTEWELWKENNIIELIKKNKNDFNRNKIASIISNLVNKWFDGVYLNASLKMGLNSQALTRWKKSKHAVPFEGLLRISYYFKCSIPNLLDKSHVNNPEFFREEVNQYRTREKKNDLERLDELKSKLQEIIGERDNSPPSLKEVSRILGVRYRFLYKYLPVESKKISATYLSYKKECTQEKFDSLKENIRKEVHSYIQLHKKAPSHNYIQKLFVGYSRVKVSIMLNEIRKNL